MSVDVLVVGTGEYVTGFTHAGATRSDKGPGVVALTLFDLRARGRVGRLLLCGRDGRRFPEIRRHLRERVAAPYGLEVACEAWPEDGREDGEAWRAALAALPPGQAVMVVTPDDTHAHIAAAALQAGQHVLVAKPLVKTLAEHDALLAVARAHDRLLAVEMHKRFDPVYADARERLRGLGPFTLFQSYMSQPRTQLDTFRSWAGRASDISYYLNSHHVDFHAWALAGRARPVWVMAAAARGLAEARLGTPVEDAITLTVTWEHVPGGRPGVALYSAAWTAPPSDVHSQQRFHALCEGGELQVDQAHRGYSAATEAEGLRSLNPLFMSYTPKDGRFAGQQGYGYRSLEAFVEAVAAMGSTGARPADFDRTLATAATTRTVTAVLEAGRRSLDAGRPVQIVYGTAAPLEPAGFH